MSNNKSNTHESQGSQASKVDLKNRNLSHSDDKQGSLNEKSSKPKVDIDVKITSETVKSIISIDEKESDGSA